MRRRDFIHLGGAAAASWPLTVRAQQKAPPVVGWLSHSPIESTRHLIAAFERGLGEAGYVDGKTLSIEYRSADSMPERLPELATDLITRGVGVIMAATPPAALAAKRATATIPIVFTSGADPVAIGLVASFNRPGGNATGFHIQYGELAGKRLSLLRELVPGLTRIAVLVNPANPTDVEPTVRAATEAAKTLSVETKGFNADSTSEIDDAFAAFTRWGAGALLVGPSPAGRIAYIASLASRQKLPASGYNREFADAGGLMSYGPDPKDMYRQAGVYVGRILKGEKPADLPVQQPTKFELILNLKTAKAFGFNVPMTMLAIANEVIE